MRANHESQPQVVIDVAGAHMGGAAKFAGELHRYLAGRPDLPVGVIGLGRSLDPRWLVEREALARTASKRIALNNVSFAVGRGNVTLLRNALHFASDRELEGLGFRPPKALRVQTRIVRATARRSATLVVPCNAMADRVAQHAPHLADRLVVRLHPVTAPTWAATRHDTEPNILIPILNAPYKRLDEHVGQLVRALASLDSNAQIRVTASAVDFPPEMRDIGRVTFLGPLGRNELESYFETATALYFPTQLESFGYPLAEARAAGLPVIAIDTPQNRQIAGPALRGFATEDPTSLEAAVAAALRVPVDPDPDPFDPTAYFDWLLESHR